MLLSGSAGRDNAYTRNESREFLEDISRSIMLDSNSFTGNWLAVAQQATKPQKLASDWDIVDFSVLKKRMAILIIALSQ